MKIGFKEENWVARYLEGKREIASGALRNSLDVHVKRGGKEYLVEVKTTTRKNFPLNKSLWEKILARSEIRAKEPLLVIIFYMDRWRKKPVVICRDDGSIAVKEEKEIKRKVLHIDPSLVGTKVKWQGNSLIITDITTFMGMGFSDGEDR